MTYSFSRRTAGLKPALVEQLQLDIADLHGRVVLPVAALNLVLIGLLELQHGDFLSAR